MIDHWRVALLIYPHYLHLLRARAQGLQGHFVILFGKIDRLRQQPFEVGHKNRGELLSERLLGVFIACLSAGPNLMIAPFAIDFEIISRDPFTQKAAPPQ